MDLKGKLKNPQTLWDFRGLYTVWLYNNLQMTVTVLETWRGFPGLVLGEGFDNQGVRPGIFSVAMEQFYILGDVLVTWIYTCGTTS